MKFGKICGAIAHYLANRYHEKTTAVRFADTVGLNTSSIVGIDGSAKDRWFAILKFAHENNQFENLVQTIFDREAPENSVPEYARFKLQRQLAQLTYKARLNPQELSEITNQVRPSKLSDQGISIEQGSSQEIDRLVEEIIEWPMQHSKGKWIPALAFASAIRHSVWSTDPFLSQEIDDWIVSASSLWGVSPHEATQHPSIATDFFNEPALQVILNGHPNNTSYDLNRLRFETRFYLWTVECKQWLEPTPQTPSKDGYYSLEEIGALTRNLAISLTRQMITGEGPLFIEFFLPYESLVVPMDHLGPKMLHKRYQQTLGDDYLVVVRPLERNRDPAYPGHSDWKRRWRQLSSSRANPFSDADMLHVIESEQMDYRNLLSDLLLRQDLSCVGIPIATEDMIWAGLAAGIPVMCWLYPFNLQRIDQHISLREAVTEVLRTKPIHEVPKNVRAKRVAIRSTSPESNLSLIWDNANRIPREFEEDLPAFHAPLQGE